MLGSLIAVASLVVEHRLQSAGSVAEHELSCRVECGIFSNQGLNPSLLHWQVGS